LCVFYVLYECGHGSPQGTTFFSRDLRSESDLIASLVVLPPFQKRGYGHLLISLAYELAKRVRAIGGPMRPLSEDGCILFRHFWRATILEMLQATNVQTIDEIAAATAICQDDVAEVLGEFRCFVRAEHGWRVDRDAELLVRTIAKFTPSPRARKIDGTMLTWLPEDAPRLPTT
jgi:histone acetyltransferase MYST1